MHLLITMIRKISFAVELIVSMSKYIVFHWPKTDDSFNVK